MPFAGISFLQLSVCSDDRIDHMFSNRLTNPVWRWSRNWIFQISCLFSSFRNNHIKFITLFSENPKLSCLLFEFFQKSSMTAKAWMEETKKYRRCNSNLTFRLFINSSICLSANNMAQSNCYEMMKHLDVLIFSEEFWGAFRTFWVKVGILSQPAWHFRTLIAPFSLQRAFVPYSWPTFAAHNSSRHRYLSQASLV